MYLTNPNGSLKLDSLGRRRHVNQAGKGGALRGKGAYTHSHMVRLDEITYNELKAKAGKGKISELIRTYIVWGIETEREG